MKNFHLRLRSDGKCRGDLVSLLNPESIPESVIADARKPFDGSGCIHIVNFRLCCCHSNSFARLQVLRAICNSNSNYSRVNAK